MPLPTQLQMQSREVSVLTLIYVRRPGEVLLGLKKRGFGAGKVNGFGGKLEPGECLEESVVRELHEETGLTTGVEDLRWCGTLTYIYDTKPKAMEVHIFDLERWDGTPAETEEMKPEWYGYDAIPLQDMWADDEFWLVQYLRGDLKVPFGGRFRFQGHEGDDSKVMLEHAVSCLQPGRGLRLSCIPERRPGAAMIISTVSFKGAPCSCARPLESFLRFHFLKGFSVIMLVIDDASDVASLTAASKFPKERVIIRIRDEALREEQRKQCSSFETLLPLYDSEVSARQMLDAELAMAVAPTLGCSWVTCLDSDELFFTREASVVPHFEKLVETGVHQMTYLNHEAVPEVLNTEDYFATTTLFRKHHFVVPLSEAARNGLRFWRNRSRRNQYLLFYDNGKSACRSGLKAAKARSQHLWQLPEGCRSCTALADARRLGEEEYMACEDPCILHFPICGLSWAEAKYRTLGHFPDAWLGGKVKLPESFHGDARDACAKGSDALEALFRAEVLLADRAEATRQISSGVCLRLLEHAQLLDAVPSQVEITEQDTQGTAAADTEKSASSGALDAGPQGIEFGWIVSKSIAGYL